jgi:hypothetical protein
MRCSPAAFQLQIEDQGDGLRRGVSDWLVDKKAPVWGNGVLASAVTRENLCLK